MLKQMIDKYSVNTDKSHIYIAGESNGAIGVWQMIDSFPELFAGAMPVALDIQYSILQHQDLRILMTQEISHKFDKKTLVGMPNKRFESVGENHGACIQKSYTIELLDWLFE